MKQNNIRLPFVFVIGNEKGGAGKTTCSVHLMAGMLDEGFSVATIDVDCRQHSLTRYLENRRDYNSRNPDYKVAMPRHFYLKASEFDEKAAKEEQERNRFEAALAKAKEVAEIIIIDTPGSHSFLSNLAHSYADTVITPINDSFIDVDVLAKINPETLDVVQPSLYSQTIWEQKMERAKRDRGSIEWIVMRNRLSNLDAINKRNVAEVLEKLQKRVAFKQAPGFSERVIFRELFLQGLTLLDLTTANFDKSFSMSHVAARQELRNFLKCINIDELKSAKEAQLV